MSGNPVGWFEIYVQNMPRARAFYEQVFATRLERLAGPDFEMWTFPMSIKRTGSSGSLVQFPGVPSGGNSTVVYFNCADCAVEESRVVPAGGTVHRPKTAIGEHGFISLVHDTEGNLIGLHSRS